MKNLYKIQDELYIVSDKEKSSYCIKECPMAGLNIDRCDCQISTACSNKVGNIILTTNKLLIKDGVQAINDEFLKWFVKNPSCKRVEIFEQYRKCCRNTDGTNEDCIEPINCEGWLNSDYERPYKTNCDKRFEGYKIIIPKEESKQKRDINTCRYFDIEVGCEREKCTCENQKPKQETLEEALEKYSKEIGVGNMTYLKCAEFGAKWQEQNSDKKWSDEDMKLAYYSGKENEYNFINKYHFKVRITFEEWFEQFKKR